MSPPIHDGGDKDFGRERLIYLRPLTSWGQPNHIHISFLVAHVHITLLRVLGGPLEISFTSALLGRALGFEMKVNMTTTI